MNDTIWARFTPDDNHRAHSITFNVVSWLRRAKVAEVAKLASEGWGGNYSADAVAWASRDPRVVAALDYVQDGGLGFEVHVDRVAALEWLKANRPKAFKAACAAERAWRQRVNQPYRKDPLAAAVEAQLSTLLGGPKRRPTHLRLVTEDQPVPPCVE